ncbi:hypothetical protein ORV05_27255 [Amycolatopsis cynarae]|uniref:Nucleotide exchange factor GrpE n=1 Tax=Amycolatopsis cynarae TaxID=2995223 RepID=A0ABY7B037_9PSEU|nr:hypothetical protein [Amycolatopsis sp. HUAS 11-8]WAL64633.1 hypothetical protein ORV05_27255 [Amycolatopsis sp. HUAS 11-8]
MNRPNRLGAAVRAELRQRRHHPAFRIDPPVLGTGQRLALEQLLARTPAAPGPESSEVDSVEEGPVDEKALAEAATNLWRAQRRLAGDGERTSSRERQAGRYLRTVRDALAEAGLVVQDHDGDTFHPGRSLEALLFQEEPGLTTETVLETVRPSVYFHDRRIQMGQVIVGSPAPGPGPTDQ